MAHPRPALVALGMNDSTLHSTTHSDRWRLLGHRLARHFRAGWLQGAALLVVSFLVRSPSLTGQRIWDDQYLSWENPFIKSPLLILESFRHYLFPESFSTHYRPVQNISYTFDYFFWNTDTYGYHLTNTSLHAASGVLLFLLMRKIFASLWLRETPLAVRDRMQKRLPGLSLTAFFVALLWSVHPVHSAAIDYISGRADSLAFVFAAVGWLLVFRGRAKRSARARYFWFGLAAISGLLALLSREIACVWFALFLGHLIFVEKTMTRRARLAGVIVCLCLVGVYAEMRQLPVSRARSSDDGWAAPVRVMLMARSLGDYTRLLFYPGNLHMERTILDATGYQNNASWRAGVGIEYLSLLGLATFAALVAGCCRRGTGRTLRIFGAAWFFAGYLPISNLLTLNATVAEHWLYLPSVGFLIFLAGCVFDLPVRCRRAAIPVACLALIGLSARSLVRSTDWADEETFYSRTIAAGGSTTRAAVNLAEIYSRKGNLAGSERIFRRVLELTPDYPMARNNFANLLHKQGRKAEAEAIFDSSSKASGETKKVYPGTWVAAVNLAHMKRAEGDIDGTVKILEQARLDYPETWEVIRFHAEVLRTSKRADAAMQLVEDFARKKWWHYEASIALGRLYAEQGDSERATTAWRHASWLDVHDAESLNLMAGLRLRQNRLDEAFKIQRRAIARQPDQPRQYRMLSDILAKMGRTDEARAALAQVSQMEAFAHTHASLN
jgi:protein O-mannosyl-transferase